MTCDQNIVTCHYADFGEMKLIQMNPGTKLTYYQAIVAVTVLNFDYSHQYAQILCHPVHFASGNHGDGGGGGEEEEEDGDDVGVGDVDVDVLYYFVYENALDVDV